MAKAGTSLWARIKERWEIVVSLGTVAICALGVAGYWGYIAQYRLPDIDKKLEEMKKAEADRWGANERRQAEQFAKFDATLTTLKVNLILLMQKSGKTPTPGQLKDLLSSVESTASNAAELVGKAQVTQGTIQNLPTITKWTDLNFAAGKPVTKYVLFSDDDLATSGSPTSSKANLTAEHDLKNVVTRLLVGDNVRWEEANGKITARYGKGAVLFTPKYVQSAEDLKSWVNEANTLHDNLATISMKIPKQVNDSTTTTTTTDSLGKPPEK